MVTEAARQPDCWGDVIDLRLDTSTMELLARSPILLDASRDSLRRVASSSTLVELQPGERLTTAGASANYVDFLVEGWVRLFHEDGGRQLTRQILGSPCTIGELAALARLPYSEDAEALTAGWVLRVERDAFCDLVESQPPVARALLEELSTRASRASATARDALRNTTGRLAGLLLSYQDAFGRETEDGVQIRLPLTQQKLANDLGVTERAVRGILARMRDDGIVVSRKGWLLVRDPGALRTLRGDGAASGLVHRRGT